MLAEFGHASADYADERFPVQTPSSLFDANRQMLNMFKNHSTKQQVWYSIYSLELPYYAHCHGFQNDWVSGAAAG
jgi:hypothetical protein